MSSKHSDHDPFDISGRVFLVTGAAGLLGERYSRALCERGARVGAIDIDEAGLEREFSGMADVVQLPVDITNLEGVRRAVADLFSEFGRIDGLVNNAAIDPKFEPGDSAGHTQTFEDFPLREWQRSLSVNLTGMFLCTQAVIPHMLERGRGVIVNISSTYGLVGPDQRLYKPENEDEPTPYKPVTYTVTKSAVLGFTKYLATYYGEQGIRANTLSLGGVFNDHDDVFVKRYSARTPLGRMADRSEYEAPVIFLLSDASSYMTGANLIVDGGWTAW